jgi:hypothetical protein
MAQAAQVSPVARTRQATPKRWQAALTRALAEHVTVRQVNATGMWVTTSGTDAAMAYLLEITGGVLHACTCPDGQFNDPVCKHRARWYFDAGLLDLDNRGRIPRHPRFPVPTPTPSPCPRRWPPSRD